MKYEIIFAPEAVEDLHRLKASLRVIVRDAIVTYLRHEPTKTSKSRIKRLRGLSRPQYRLRVEDVRVYYDVTPKSIEILAIVSKEDASKWLEELGEPYEDSGPE